MEEPEERQFNSLAERIAALKAKQELDASPSQDSGPPVLKKRPPPPPPPAARSQTAPVAVPQAPLRPTTSPAVPSRPVTSPAPSPAPSGTPASPPPLPRRTPTSPSLVSKPPPPPLPHRASSTSLALPGPSPALPPRRPSVNSLHGGDINGRRNSASSEISTTSALSIGGYTASSATSLASTPTRKLPPTFDQASLPALPPSRRERQEKEAAEKEAAALRTRSSVAALRSQPSIPEIAVSNSTTPRPVLPPRLPSRPARSPVTKPAEFQNPETESAATPTSPPAPRRLPPPPAGYAKSPFANGNIPVKPPSRVSNEPPPVPTLSRDFREAPPPVPLASRPSEAQIEASITRLAAKHACLTCRDFSAPDAVAAQYPRHNLPQHGVVDFLAHALCDQFPSHTDKARAIFTWFHHNIAYDCDGFFNDKMRWYEPDETIRLGTAVCSGYSKTYKAIADAAGLECVVVNGHGKGINFTALKAGDPIPPRKVDGHAWNAVRIDGGEWKLLDVCWGAGNVNASTQQYQKAFKPTQFTYSNEILGLKHYPEDSGYFFRRDGRVPTWEEYILGPSQGRAPVIIYGNAPEEGIAGSSLQPFEGELSVYSGSVIRFQFSMLCEHWKPETHGRGAYLFLLSIHGLDGRNAERIPFQTDGYWYWLDVKSTDLGAPGQSVSIYTLDTFDGRDARGVTAKDYIAKRNRAGASFKSVAKWDLI